MVAEATDSNSQQNFGFTGDFRQAISTCRSFLKLLERNHDKKNFNLGSNVGFFGFIICM